ncbi:DUF5916 domain-containing protein [Candidatus Latescibacterota bacterium]
MKITHRTFILKYALLALTGIMFASTLAHAQIKPTYIEESIRLDGRVTENAWQNAQVIDTFTQQELTEGAPASEKTEVRFLYDDDNLYVSFICFDSEPDKIVHKELKRDGILRFDDRIDLVLDTYNDSRMGYFFATNPNGAMVDGTIQAVGNQPMNTNWDGIWDVRSHIGDFGWSCEIVIPLKTLRFPEKDVQIWGVNFQRSIIRKNEDALWKCWKRNEGIFELSGIGTMTMDRSLSSGRQVDIKPYLLAGVEDERGKDTDDTFKYGVDVRYAITNNTTLDLTTKTDFAQIESDQEVINLTRHNISYPEKRDFFLEGADTFDFTQGRMKMFYSRRVGLSEKRSLLPIIAGAKLTQKSGDYRLGIMSIQTGSGHGEPSANQSVIRFKKDILEQSYVGMIATNLLDEDGHDNQVYGADLGYKTTTFLGDNNLQVQSYFAMSVTDGDATDNHTGRVYINLPNDTYSLRFLYHARNEGFNPEIGFADRLGVQQYMVDYDWTPRVNLPYIKKLAFTPYNLNYYADIYNTMVSRTINFSPFGFITNADDTFSIFVRRQFEYHDEEFKLFEDVTVPVGQYEWWETDFQFDSNKSRTIAINARYKFGKFYNGARNSHGYNAECIFKTNSFYSLSGTININDLYSFGHSFETKELGSRLTLDFSTRLFTTTFIQWNNETEEMNMNFRLHYIPKIGSDIYVVYNHLMDENDADSFTTLQQAGMFKVDYTYRF